MYKRQKKPNDLCFLYNKRKTSKIKLNKFTCNEFYKILFDYKI